MQTLLSMLTLQQQLNDNTNGKQWKEGFTKQGKAINWKRCIYLESAELIESYPWKHWKNIDAPADFANIEIELVDIWHFVLSELLRTHQGSLESLSQSLSSLPSFQTFCSLTPLENEAREPMVEIEAVESFLSQLFCAEEENSLALAQGFFEMASTLQLSLDRLYQLYIGKNILNQFRQDHGYKEGSYTKEWNGKEDNVVMQSILAQQKNISPDALYDALSTCYQAL